MKYDWLLFDADGTLLDYDAGEAAALSAVFLDFAIPFKEDYGLIYQEVNLNLWKLFEQGKIQLAALRTQRFADLFSRIGVNADPEKFSERYLFHLGQSTELIPYAPEVLETLAPFFRMAIITNGISAVQRSRFSLSLINRYFETLYISEEIGISKPDTGYFDAVFKGLNFPPKESVLVIGDSLSSDMRGGANYGLDTCWYNPAGKTNDAGIPIRYEIKDLRDLLPIVLPKN